MNSEFLADSFAGVYIVMLMNSSDDDECLSGQTLNISYCVSTPFLSTISIHNYMYNKNIYYVHNYIHIIIINSRFGIYH